MKLVGPAEEGLSSYLDSWLSFKVKNSTIPGISVAIQHSDSLIFAGAYGESNVETKQPITTAHVFDVASQTKMFTSTAILLLHQRKFLNLFDVVVKHLPQLLSISSFDLSSVTIYDLLTHQSGLPRDFVSEDAFDDPFDALDATFEAFGPFHKPAYSNIGYVLLAEIIEAVSGDSYETFIDRHIVQELGCSWTRPSLSSPAMPEKADGYGYLLNQKRSDVPFNVSRLMRGAIGVWSNPIDMCRFASAHFTSSNDLLDLETKKLQQAIQWGPDGENGGHEFTIGLDSRRIAGRRFIGHTGGVEGYTSATVFQPDDEIAISVSFNCRDVQVLSDVTIGLVNALYFFAENALDDLNPETVKFAGRFAGPVTLLEVVATSSKIGMIDSLEWNPFRDAKELKQIANDVLAIAGCDFVFGGSQLRYQFDDIGSPVSLDVGPHRLNVI